MNIERARFRMLGFHEPQLPWHMAAHSHPFHELIFTVTGTQRVRMCGKTLESGPGHILLYPPGVPHEEWADAGQAFSSYFMSFSWPDCPRDAPLALDDRLGRIRVMLDWLRAETRSPSAVTPLATQSLFQSILGQFVRLWLHPDDALVDKVRGYAAAHIQEPLTLARLAAAAGMSKYHFLRKYKALTGVTPMEDLRSLRVERARDMIMTTDRPIKQIAEDVGLGTVYHLCRLFKKQVGISPGSLRRRPTRASRPPSRQ